MVSQAAEHVAYVGLGSNLGPRRRQLERAVALIQAEDGVAVQNVSQWRETEPVGGPSGQPRYLNGAAKLRTSLSARALLETLLDIERRLGRVRSAAAVRWGPRPIDLDLLLYDDAVIDEPGLSVPHPRMHARRFVMEPLAEIAPDAVHPLLAQSARSILATLRNAPADSAASASSPRHPANVGGWHG